MKQSVLASGLALWLVTLLIHSSHAWFVSYEEESSTTEEPLTTSAPQTRGRPSKVLEASEGHVSMLLKDFRRGTAGQSPPQPVQPAVSEAAMPTIVSADTAAKAAATAAAAAAATAATAAAAAAAAAAAEAPAEASRSPAMTNPPDPTTDASLVTQDFWDNLPEWLPARVRAAFQEENERFLRARRVKAATTTVGPTDAVHVTKSYWQELPSWLPSRVRHEFLRDNAEHMRRNRQMAPATTKAEPVASHVTKNYWDSLPGWVPAQVRAEFVSDNAEFLRRRGLQAPPATPTPEHVTRDAWSDLPSWLPEQVRQEFLEGNTEPRRPKPEPPQAASESTVMPTVSSSSAGAGAKTSSFRTPAGVPPPDQPVQFDPAKTIGESPPRSANTPVPVAPAASTEETLPPWLVELLSRQVTTPATSGVDVVISPNVITPKIETVVAEQRRQQVENVEGKQSRALSGTQVVNQPSAPTPAPTRPPMTLNSTQRLPPKCSRQVDWIDQPKCSASRSKWTFNMVTLRCEWFVYYGCPLSNGNIFNSRRDCESYCIKGIVDPCKSSKCVPLYSLYQSDCFLLNDQACIDRIVNQYRHIGSPVVRLEMAQEQIQLFCQPPTARCLNTGINARLPSYESPPTYDEDELSVTPPYCHLPPDRGSCQNGQRVRLSRVYYYSQRHNQCKFMMHFGCGGNLNRFANQADCYNNCGI